MIAHMAHHVASTTVCAQLLSRSVNRVTAGGSGASDVPLADSRGTARTVETAPARASQLWCVRRAELRTVGLPRPWTKPAMWSQGRASSTWLFVVLRPRHLASSQTRCKLRSGPGKAPRRALRAKQWDVEPNGARGVFVDAQPRVASARCRLERAAMWQTVAGAPGVPRR
jgi:hypothetical protein